MKNTVLKVCSIVFGALCLVALVVLLCFSISLPYTETYRVWGSVYTQSYPGYFDLTNLSSMVLLAFGAFWGIVLFFALPCGKCHKKECAKVETEEVKTDETSSCGCCCTQSEETEEK